MYDTAGPSLLCRAAVGWRTTLLRCGKQSSPSSLTRCSRDYHRRCHPSVSAGWRGRGAEPDHTRQVRGDNTLKLAWERFALYDTNAGRQQASFRTLQWCILALGVLGTLLALTHTTLKSQVSVNHIGLTLLHAVIVIVPITTAILVAAANRFNAGNKWVVLRASAEAIKQEIFHYRTRAASYVDSQTAQTAQLSREATLGL